MNKKGFTLIELLVVIVIIGILVAIALPNFIKIKDKAREAEVKQNLHSIQLAVERYATDTEGNYPYFLYGGDTRFNFGTHCSVAGLSGSNYIGYLNPFDMFNLNLTGLTPPQWCYQSLNNDWTQLKDPNLSAGFGDALEYEGYLPKYPGNPFVVGKAKAQYGMNYLGESDPNATWMSGFGGFDGTCMFNLAWWGDNFELYKFAPVIGVSPTYVWNDLPGQFTYHPRWQDGVTNIGHLTKQAESLNGGFGANTWADYGSIPTCPTGPNFDKDEVASLDVAAYDLTAIGSPRTKGQDLDDSMTLFADSPNMYRTGYLTQAQERNPWMKQGASPWNVLQDYSERPFSDSIPDFIVIHLSSGIDKKVQNELNRSQ